MALHCGSLGVDMAFYVVSLRNRSRDGMKQASNRPQIEVLALFSAMKLRFRHHAHRLAELQRLLQVQARECMEPMSFGPPAQLDPTRNRLEINDFHPKSPRN